MKGWRCPWTKLWQVPLQSHVTNLNAHNISMEILNAVLYEDTGKLMEYRHLIKIPKYCQLYGTSYRKELGWISQVMTGLFEGTDTIFFIDKANVPTSCSSNVTYVFIVVNYRLVKSDPYRMRLTISGNQVNYPHDCGTPTYNILTVKFLLNSVFSTTGAKFMTIKIKYF